MIKLLESTRLKISRAGSENCFDFHDKRNNKHCGFIVITNGWWENIDYLNNTFVLSLNIHEKYKNISYAAECLDLYLQYSYKERENTVLKIKAGENDEACEACGFEKREENGEVYYKMNKEIFEATKEQRENNLKRSIEEESNQKIIFGNFAEIANTSKATETHK